MLNEEVLDERRRFQMITWRAKQHGAQVVEKQMMQRFTDTVAEQQAILAAARRQEAPAVS
ncbi:hypothetical protein [Levilactobacillus angrenensis]|uniref:Uncharacterized protein n=1 Tax=Levilactobacillus angrenensis TaxID=2486020 RepID=A0ABW1UCZ2_9LACO|nr:hypothetical protein [Levilactobacillus angrenensis]